MNILESLLQPSNDKQKVIDGKLYWHHSLLSNWDRNEEYRILKEKDWLRLLKSIKKNGVKNVFKIGMSGTVYDGNHRLRAINELISEGVTEALNGKNLEWVPVEVYSPKTESEELALAVEGNGDTDFAIWNKDAVANHKDLFTSIPDYEDYSFTFDDPVTFGDVFESYIEDPVTDEETPVQTKKDICEECESYHRRNHDKPT